MGWGDVLGVWDGNTLKLDCDDHCTTINVINSLSKKNKNSPFQLKKKKKKTLVYMGEKLLLLEKLCNSILFYVSPYILKSYTKI